MTVLEVNNVPWHGAVLSGMCSRIPAKASARGSRLSRLQAAGREVAVGLGLL